MSPLSPAPCASFSSQRFKSSVCRRYNDFVVFHELLLHKFPYRMVPALPPKRMLGGTVGLLEVGAGTSVGKGPPRRAEVLAPWWIPLCLWPPEPSSGPLPQQEGWQQGCSTSPSAIRGHSRALAPRRGLGRATSPGTLDLHEPSA